MAKAKEKKSPDIIFSFMQEVLLKERYPKSVYKFCKKYQIEEAYFYKKYPSLERVKQAIWLAFYENTHSLLEQNPDFVNASRKDRLLMFYFTFFEVLLLNRSYVLFSLGQAQKGMAKWSSLKLLRTSTLAFAAELIEEGNEEKQLKIAQNPVRLFSQAAWAQLLFLMKFWMEDQSDDFEKTDALIEKSVQVAFEVFDNTRLEKIIDLGKFLWKETLGEV